MIGPTGPVPNYLRQRELGEVPEAISHEKHAEGEPHDGENEEPEARRKANRRRWFRFWRRG